MYRVQMLNRGTVHLLKQGNKFLLKPSTTVLQQDILVQVLYWPCYITVTLLKVHVSFKTEHYIVLKTT